MSEELRIEFERADRTYHTGEVVRGMVHLDTARGDRCKEVRLTRYWRTHGKGNTAKGNELDVVLHHGPLEGPGPWKWPFELATPPSPFTYRGELLNVDHYVRVAVDIPWAFDPKLEEEFVLLPGEDIDRPGQAILGRKTDAAGQAAGCRKSFGVLAIIVGLLTLPLGLVFAAVGVLLIFPDLFKRIASMKAGTVNAGLHPTLVTPGDAVSLRVRIRPMKAVKLNGVVATLEGREVCVSGSGTDRTTHTHVVHRKEIRLAGPTTLSPGRKVVLAGDVGVPDGAPFSFHASDNTLDWRVAVRVDIPAWPDWREELPLAVWPATRDRIGEPEGMAGTVAGAEELPRLTEPTASVDPLQADEPARGVGGTAAVSGVAEERERPEEPDTTGTPAPPEEAPADVPAGEGAAERPGGGGAEAGGGPLAAAVRAVLDEPSFGGALDDRIAELEGSDFTFELVVERVERSFGVWDAPRYRDGHTALGSVADTDVEVTVRFPGSATDDVEGLKRGARRTVTGTVVKWDRLAERCVVHAEDAGSPPS